MNNRLQQAFNELVTELFGFVPDDIYNYSVTRKQYTEVMNQIEDKYNIKQGDRDYLEWVLTLVGRSPKIIEEGAEANDG